MTHSIQTIGDRAAIVRDNDLIILISLLREQLEMEPLAYKRARPIVDSWRRQLQAYTPGAIEMDLDAVAGEDAQELLSLLEALRRRVSQSEMVSRQTLAKFCDAKNTVFHGDVPSSSVAHTIQQLADLFSPVPTD